MRVPRALLPSYLLTLASEGKFSGKEDWMDGWMDDRITSST